MGTDSIKLSGGSYPLKRITIFIGNYGSGKTEIAVNFSIALARAKLKAASIRLIDLDIANPYFRCREASEQLESYGVETIFPKGEYTWADLPIILPEIKGTLERRDGLAILDVGGDDVGARVLASLADWIDAAETEALFVLNICRPFTEDVGGAMQVIDEVSKAGMISVTGIVANPHLIDETSLDVVQKGIELAKEVSKKTKIPIRFAGVMRDVLEKSPPHRFDIPILKMERLMLPPWKRHEGF